MFIGEASPEATEGNSPPKATKHSTTEPLALSLYTLLWAGRRQGEFVPEECEDFGN